MIASPEDVFRCGFPDLGSACVSPTIFVVAQAQGSMNRIHAEEVAGLWCQGDTPLYRQAAGS